MTQEGPSICMPAQTARDGGIAVAEGVLELVEAMREDSEPE